MKYNVGDKVRIKSIDWYNKNKDEDGIVELSTRDFIPEMIEHCGTVVIIKDVFEDIDDNVVYCMEDIIWDWTNDMIECKVEEENTDCEKCGLTHNSTRCLFMDNCPHNKQKTIIEIHEDWVFKDENDNIINATKIILEKKKKEYPKTYEECLSVLKIKGYDIVTYVPSWTAYEKALYQKVLKLRELVICRDAYWKIAGDELGLGKPWEPDWLDDNLKPCIGTASNEIIKCTSYSDNTILAFPTAEMRDAFYENFKELIEMCKELL